LQSDRRARSIGSCGRGWSGQSWARSKSEADTSCRFATPRTSTYRATGKCLGINAARTIHSLNGGNVPNVNALPRQWPTTRREPVLMAGGEARNTQPGEQATLPVSWSEGPGGRPEIVGDPREQTGGVHSGSLSAVLHAKLDALPKMRCTHCAITACRHTVRHSKNGSRSRHGIRPESRRGGVVSFANGPHGRCNFVGSAEPRLRWPTGAGGAARRSEPICCRPRRSDIGKSHFETVNMKDICRRIAAIARSRALSLL
jgi:hypothetical protein